MNILRRIAIHPLGYPLKKAGAFILSKLRLTAWARLHTGQLLKVDLPSAVGRSIWLRGIYEPEVEAYIRKVLRPKDAFIDVGAHVGYFSVIAAGVVGEEGEVHAFEPQRELCSLLKMSIEANALFMVRINPLALWSDTINVILMTQQDSGFSFVQAPSSGRFKSAIMVPTTTLDEYVHHHVHCPVRVIKIDVEGAELHVLLGAQRTLQTHSPCLVVEAQDCWLQRFGHKLEDLFDYLSGFG